MNYRSGMINIGKDVADFPDVAWSFLYTLLKFDIFSANNSFSKRGGNFEMDVKLSIPIFNQFHWKMHVKKMFVLTCIHAVLFYQEKDQKKKPFMRLV